MNRDAVVEWLAGQKCVQHQQGSPWLVHRHQVTRPEESELREIPESASVSRDHGRPTTRCPRHLPRHSTQRVPFVRAGPLHLLQPLVRALSP